MHQTANCEISQFPAAVGPVGTHSLGCWTGSDLDHTNQHNVILFGIVCVYRFRIHTHRTLIVVRPVVCAPGGVSGIEGQVQGGIDDGADHREDEVTARHRHPVQDLFPKRQPTHAALVAVLAKAHLRPATG